MPKKTNKIEIGSLWQGKDASNKQIYIVTGLITHYWTDGSVNIKHVDKMDSATYNVSIIQFLENYRKIS